MILLSILTVLLWLVSTMYSKFLHRYLAGQGDKETSRGIGVSPLCDRGDQNLPKSQCDFIDFIVRPCVTIFSMYCKVSRDETLDLQGCFPGFSPRQCWKRC